MPLQHSFNLPIERREPMVNHQEREVPDEGATGRGMEINQSRDIPDTGLDDVERISRFVDENMFQGINIPAKSRQKHISSQSFDNRRVNRPRGGDATRNGRPVQMSDYEFRENHEYMGRQSPTTASQQTNKANINNLNMNHVKEMIDQALAPILVAIKGLAINTPGQQERMVPRGQIIDGQYVPHTQYSTTPKLCREWDPLSRERNEPVKRDRNVDRYYIPGRTTTEPGPVRTAGFPPENAQRNRPLLSATSTPLRNNENEGVSDNYPRHGENIRGVRSRKFIKESAKLAKPVFDGKLRNGNPKKFVRTYNEIIEIEELEPIEARLGFISCLKGEAGRWGNLTNARDYEQIVEMFFTKILVRKNPTRSDDVYCRWKI